MKRKHVAAVVLSLVGMIILSAVPLALAYAANSSAPPPPPVCPVQPTEVVPL